jgi:uncharacterized phosphosugar-binding protein
MALIESYRDRVTELLDRLVATQAPAIAKAAALVAESWAAGGLVYITGSGHSHMIAEEVFYRAGGAAAVQAILDPALMLHQGAEKSSMLEREEGYAETVMSTYPLAARDVLFVVSNSGRNAFPIEAALHARARGTRTVAITSMEAAGRSPPRHSGGESLHQVADLVIDNQVAPGDAALPLTARDIRMGPTSTIAGVFIMNAIMAHAVDALASKGRAIDVYQSANVDGSNTAEIVERWRGRIIGL